jgi:hypothetical protein
MLRLPRAAAANVGRAIVIASSITIALVCASGHAAAEDKDADAERLFREGQKLLEERRYGEACPKFEAAYAKDRQLGTLINLAFCHKEQGSIWYAWLEFREAELKAGEMKRFERRDFARERLNELERSLPRVAIDNPKKVTLVEVLVEEKRVPEAEHGSTFTAEEGKRKFTFRAKGKKSATVLVPIGAKSSDKQHIQRVPVPEMVDGEDESALPPTAVGTPPPVESVFPPSGGSSASDPGAGSAQRTLGLGGAAVVVGGVTGVMTLTNPCAQNFMHDKSPSCSQSDRDGGDTTSMISNVSLIVAGAAGATGLVLLLTAPSRPSSPAGKEGVIRPQLGVGWAGLRGTF